MSGYMTGFGNQFETEALAGSLPIGRNSPQKVAHGLYAELLSGSAFTLPRAENLRSWLYRTQPSVCHEPFQKRETPWFESCPMQKPSSEPADPNPMRWNALGYPDKPTHFVDAMRTFCVTGSVLSQGGSGVHMYAATASMTEDFFYNSDGEMLILPQEGALKILTEMGVIEVEPLEICVIPRGIKFQVVLKEARARGYVCENYGYPFRLPDLGPIGSNGLANPRDFETPQASYLDESGSYNLINKFNGAFWQAEMKHHPLNVVAWHGNYAPYKYDLRKFCTMNTVAYDHADPSIFTVLTSPSGRPGLANIDFVIFPPRWVVAEDTFRPPYYHRNIMSEYMGLIQGVYDAKEKEGGFVPGGGSLHNCMTAHGPEADVFEKASNAKLEPMRYKDTMAFMFESRTMYIPTDFAMNGGLLQKDYHKCWQDLQKNFKET